MSGRGMRWSRRDGSILPAALQRYEADLAASGVL